jgi:hypothetical protein
VSIRVTGTLEQVAVGLPIVDVADVAGAMTASDVSDALSAAESYADGAVGDAVAGIPDATASAKGLATSTQIAKLDGIAAGAQVNLAVGTTAGTVAAGDDGRLGTLLATVNGSPVAVSNIDTMQAGAGGRIGVDSLGQKFPKQSEFDKLIFGSGQANIADPGLRAITSGLVFRFRQEDRYTDPGTGQVRSRAWNDPDKYLILGETGDACPQIGWTGNRGVKTVAGATSCIRIPNAYIDPDSTFSVTIFLSAPPGNTVANRPLLMVGSMHGVITSARVIIRQNAALQTHSAWNLLGTGYTLAGICPYAITVAAATGATGSCAFTRTSATSAVSTAKAAGTIYANDHVIGGWWDETGGVWHSYAGFYVHAVIIHATTLGTEAVTELHSALIDPTAIDGAISIGQSNNGLVGSATVPPNAPPLPDYRSASNESSYQGEGRGWGPVEPSSYWGTASKNQYSVTQGIAPHLPGYILFKMTLGGQQMISFYDWTHANFVPLIENLMKQAWQLGCAVNLKHIITVNGESEADISASAAEVQSRCTALAYHYRYGFQPIVGATQSAVRVTVTRLNDRYALVRAVGTPLVQQGQAAFVAADANARLVNPNSIPVLPGADNTHYDADGRIVLGDALGAAAIGV